jgi:glycerol kinase
MKTQQFILALDQGTTSSRAILFDQTGAIRGAVQEEFRQIFPRPGWVEHDANEIWTSQARVARAVLRQSKVRAESLAAIGITNQRETTLVWDRETGQPIAHAIVWQDRRTAPTCQRLKAQGRSPLIRRKTGLVIDPYFSATKLQWILHHVPGARAKARSGRLAFGTIDSWLVWQLTGGRHHVTDVTNASRTMLFNLERCDWDLDLLRLFDIPRALLPEVRSSSEVYGQATLFDVPVPIAGIAGDQQAALFGQACTRPGLVKNTYGTGCFLLMHTGSRPVRSGHKLITTVAWRIGSKTDYALEGSVFVGGAVVQWLRDGLGLIRSSGEVEELASGVPDNGGVYFVPAFAGLGAPHWDAHARGLIVGLTRGTTGGHVARAALESIAFQTQDVLQAMQADAGIRIRELRVDGGASVNNLLMQFQADLLGVPVVRPQVTETTALGAAYLAGLAVGFWKDTATIARQWRSDKVFPPAMPSASRRELLQGWSKALHRAKSWEHHEA